MKRIILFGSLAIFVAAFAAACRSGSKPTAENPIQGKVVASGPINNLTVTLSNDTGKLKNGEQEIMLAFTDASGKAVDVGMVKAAALNFYMPAMGSMAAMNNAASFTTTSVPGVYRGKVNIEMPGEWQAQISYEGANGSGKASIPVTAQ